jgi:hypothetical protein
LGVEEAVNEKPILFSGEMLKAILEGRKSQTRRVIKEILTTCRTIEPNGPRTWAMKGYGPNGWTISCPYGAAGDRLWVRETWGYCCGVHGKPPECDQSCIGYRAENHNIDEEHWRPSIFMPRWASRITLEIVKIRAERVQAIDNHESWLEGIPDFENWTLREGVARDEFSRLWDSINAARGYGWDTNPWVWVIEFKRVQP